MASEKRIADLKRYCEEWCARLDSATAARDHWLAVKQSGVSIQDHSGRDVLQDMIDAEDSAVLQYQRILIRMEALRNRAIAGEDD